MDKQIKIDRVTISEKHTGIKGVRTVGLYVNGALYYEGYSIPDRVWLDLLGEAGCQTRSFSDEESIDAGWSERVKSLPAAFDEIKFRGNVVPNGLPPPLPIPEPVYIEQISGYHCGPEDFGGEDFPSDGRFHYEDPNR